MVGSTIDWHGCARQPCPACNRGPSDRALGVTVNPDGSAIARCFRCSFIELRAANTARPLPRPQKAAQAAQKRETLSEYGRELWAACGAISGPARAYLEARGCVIPPADGHLRWHPELRHPSGYAGPALVALVTDAVDYRIARTLHRTWVCRDGRKATEANPARLLLGGHRKAGGVIRLWPDDAVTEGLGIAEGIETALSLAHAFTPVWSAIDAGNLAALPVLAGVEHLVIAADRDAAGLAAAEACAARWHRAGRRVRLVLPDADGADLNDEVRADATVV